MGNNGQQEDASEAGDPTRWSPADRERNRLQTFLEITFANIDQGITIYDADLRLIAWNQKYVDMGIVPTEGFKYGASLVDYYYRLAEAGTFGPGDPVEHAERRIRSVRGNSPDFIPSEILTPASGRQIRIERFPLADGGICATFTDISDEKKQREAMLHSQKLDELGHLISGNVHDVTNRAQVVQGYMELARSESNTTNKDRYIELAIRAVEEVRQLASSVLRFGEHKPSQAELCNLVQVTEDWVSVFRSLLSNGVGLSVRQVHPVPELWLDRWQYQNCLLNLINNAQDAIRDEGDIIIELSANPEYVVVSCLDNGVGIKPEDTDRVAEPHFTTKGDAGGTGLGLYMVDNFCKQFGGYLKVDSEKEKGTKISMYLPVLQQER